MKDGRESLIWDEYETACHRFLSVAVEELARQKDDIYAQVPRETMEHVPDAEVAIEGSESVEIPAKDIKIDIAFDRLEAIEGKRELLLATIDELASKLVSSLMSYMFQSISDVCESTGNKIKAKGGISYEHIIEMIEKVDVEFDDEGQPTTTIVMSPEMAKEFKELGPPTPEMEERVKQITEKKRQAYNARKRSRKLPSERE